MTTKTNYYETMFLISQAAAADFGSAIDHIRGLFARIDAEIVALSKWDERRLAYPIERQLRGTYLLVYYQGDPERNTAIRRELDLSEVVLRHMTSAVEAIPDGDGRLSIRTGVTELEEGARLDAPDEPLPAGSYVFVEVASSLTAWYYWFNLRCV